jgi:hypothetical protein
VAAMDLAKIIHQIKRLAIASDSFQQCLSLLGHIENLGLKLEDDLYTPMIAGVVVTYAKNFNQADGLGPLPNFFEKFPDPMLQTAHEKVIEARNKHYAHRDTIAHSFKKDQGRPDPYSVHVRINYETKDFKFQPNLIDIPPERIKQIIQLIQFQMDRLQKDLDEKLALIIDVDKNYEQDKVYILGEDFP